MLYKAREKFKHYSMTPQERHAYDEHLSALMIQNDVLDTAKLEGRAEECAEERVEGIQEAKLENARRMKEKGYSPMDISDITGLSLEEISKLESVLK